MPRVNKGENKRKAYWSYLRDLCYDLNVLASVKIFGNKFKCQISFFIWYFNIFKDFMSLIFLITNLSYGITVAISHTIKKRPDLPIPNAFPLGARAHCYHSRSFFCWWFLPSLSMPPHVLTPDTSWRPGKKSEEYERIPRKV